MIKYNNERFTVIEKFGKLYGQEKEHEVLKKDKIVLIQELKKGKRLDKSVSDAFDKINAEEVMKSVDVSSMLKTDETKPVHKTLKLNEKINNLNMMPNVEHMTHGEVAPANADDKYYNVMDERKTSCFVGSGECSPLCSGAGGNPCNIVSPVPGPTWQPQSASKVQDRLNKGQYVPSTCNSAGKMRYGNDKDCAGSSSYVQSMYMKQH